MTWSTVRAWLPAGAAFLLAIVGAVVIQNGEGWPDVLGLLMVTAAVHVALLSDVPVA